MSMFCYQCQETCKNTGCTIHGVCGKKEETAKLQDVLIQHLKALAQTQEHTEELGLFIIRSLFMTITNANFDDTRFQRQIEEAKKRLGATPVQTPLGVLSCEDEEIRSLRELITYGLKGIAAYTEHAAVLGKYSEPILTFVMRALKMISEDQSEEKLLAMVLECGQNAVKAMELLDSANTTAYGHPEATKVKLGVGTRPGILVSGHDLRDLKELLEQTRDSGIDVYTHGEMLPAHAYPEFKKYPHLYGNYGNSWHRQNTEFAAFNGPILMTTNCITPVQGSYRDRIFTTGSAGYPGVPHIADRKNGKAKDFTPLIECAKYCDPPIPLENGTLTIGFAHHQIFQLADAVAAAIRSGAVKRFIVMAGCDGRHKTREYFTEVAEKLPADTVILTAGCAKYRYNKLDLGAIGAIPRVLDAGQCNDSYSLALVALRLKEILGHKDLTALPVSFDIAWYEQKAVAVLLGLLALGFRDIHLGPTLPAFLSPGVAGILVKKFGIQCTGSPEEDIAEMMNGK